MRTNAVTKCAVGAMLFGGTLGLSQSASAAVVSFLATVQGTGPIEQRASSGVGVYLEGHGTTFHGPTRTLQSSYTLTDGNTAVTASVTGPAPVDGYDVGIALRGTRSVAGSGLLAGIAVQRAFTVEGGSVNWAGSMYNSSSSESEPGICLYRGYSVDPVTGVPGDLVFAFDIPANTVLHFSGTLAEGTYVFAAFCTIAYGTYTDATYATFSIPAPGAVVLLGVAGLVGSRRRR